MAYLLAFPTVTSPNTTMLATRQKLENQPEDKCNEVMDDNHYLSHRRNGSTRIEYIESIRHRPILSANKLFSFHTGHQLVFELSVPHAKPLL